MMMIHVVTLPPETVVSFLQRKRLSEGTVNGDEETWRCVGT